MTISTPGLEHTWNGKWGTITWMAFACVKPNLHQTAREMATQIPSHLSLSVPFRSICLNRAANVEERTRIQTKVFPIQERWTAEKVHMQDA